MSQNGGILQMLNSGFALVEPWENFWMSSYHDLRSVPAVLVGKKKVTASVVKIHMLL